MDKELFQVPISFHIFNRPELTRKVFEEIKKIRPCKLFITADGPRKNIKDDLKHQRFQKKYVKLTTTFKARGAKNI